VFNAITLYRAELDRLLDGETPLAAISCQVAFGADRLERSPEELDRLVRLLPPGLRDRAATLLHEAAPERDEKGWQRALDKVVDALSGDLVDGDPERWIGGISASGPAGSWARHLSTVLDDAGLPYCVVTPSRVVFADHDLKTSSFTELVSMPRGAILHARRAGRFLQRGRVVLDFADLSTLALATGILFTGPARRLVAVLDGPAGPEGDRSDQV
jgi:hypothetical protein